MNYQKIQILYFFSILSEMAFTEYLLSVKQMKANIFVMLLTQLEQIHPRHSSTLEVLNQNLLIILTFLFFDINFDFNF